MDDWSEDNGDSPPVILVVTAVPVYRAMVGNALDAVAQLHESYATWRAAIAATVERPACIVADLDNIDGLTTGLALVQSKYVIGRPNSHYGRGRNSE